MLNQTYEGTHIVEPSEGLEIRKIGKNTIFVIVNGHLTIEKARVMMSVTSKVIGTHGSIYVFDDWENVTGYDLRTRIEMTQFVLTHMKQLPAVHVLVRSNEVAFGVEVANFVLKYKMVVHDARNTFEQEYAKHLISLKSAH